MDYLSRLAKSAEQKKSEEITFLVEKAELQAQADILATKQQITSIKSRIEQLKASNPLNLGLIIEEQNQLTGYTDGLAQLQTLILELFPKKK